MSRCVALLASLVIFPAITFGDIRINNAVEQAMADPARPEADKKRDANRKPLETLQFFGLQPDMRVLEVIPGGGWYTRILAPVLRDEGELMVGVFSSRLAKKKNDEAVFEKVTFLDIEIESSRDHPFRLVETEEYELGVSDLDMVLTFRNLHNFTADSRNIMNRAIFKSLKSGGLYGVVDHTARHMQPISKETRRRLDPVVVIYELQAIGFELVDYTDIHYKSSDDLSLEVGDPKVSGASDRFTLLFKKP